MKTKSHLALAFGLAIAAMTAGCDDDPSTPGVDGGDNLGGMGGTVGTGGTGGGMPGTGGMGGMNPDGGVPDGGGDAELTFGAFVIDLIKNHTNETEAPTSLEGRTFNMMDDVSNDTTFVELLK